MNAPEVREFGPDARVCRGLAKANRPPVTEFASILSSDDAAAVSEFWSNWPGYQASPVYEFPKLAAQLGIKEFLVKHEGERFPVGSFKQLGPPYALGCALAEIVAREKGVGPPKLESLMSGDHADVTSNVVACAATSGNHGRALAWAASLLRCESRIFMPESVSAAKAAAIKGFGARVTRAPGDFDHVERLAVDEAKERGYLMIGGEPRSARRILQGYSRLASEWIEDRDDLRVPSHLFVPAGSGLLAAAMAGRMAIELGDQGPRIVVVQPDSADSHLQSLLAGELKPAKGDLITIMDGLSVGELNADAWTILRACGCDAITISDDLAKRTLVLFSDSKSDDPALRIGETGIAAIAAAYAMARDPARSYLEIDGTSRILAIATEGVT